MVSWPELQEHAPQIGAALRRLLADDVPVAFVSTLARDGGPRIAPFCPILSDSGLYLIAAVHTPKTADLRRDPRCAVHLGLGESDEELALRGRAVELTDVAEREQAQAAAGFHFDPDDPIFRISIGHALWVHWENPGRPDMRAIRQRWSVAGD